ncbi:hypothetical protein Trydic_g9640 [Trypoxylus dichotomus]
MFSILFWSLLILRTLGSSAFTNSTDDYEYCILVKKPVPNYYWRKYEGVIPPDAVPGGHTPSGEITYIGQVLVTGTTKNALLPATIYVGTEEVEAAFNGVHKNKRYVAILCSNTPSTLKWKQVNINEANLVNEYLIVGGYEVSQTAFIGRASYNNYLVVGKVFLETMQALKIPAPTGVIPEDAIPGGHTPAGAITYIGQVLVTGSSKNALIPGTIYVGKSEVEAAFYGIYRSKQYSAILCSDTPWALKWKQVKEDEFHLVRGYLVTGGYEISRPVFIGRVSYTNYLIVGKLFTETVRGL